jgi:hypothetical protein
VTVAVTLAAIMAPAVRVSGIATADDKVVLGGGAGITVNGTFCTLATIGHDNTGALVGFTAASCGGPGSPVTAEGSGTPVGSVAAANDYLHYSVIKFDPAKVTPTASFAGFAINGIGPDPTPGQPACKQGGATGRDCHNIRPFLDSTPERPIARIAASYGSGDDGGPVTSDDLLVAMITSGFINAATPPFPVGHPAQPENRVIYISAILNDVNAKGGPGAGFTPIPA